MTDSISSLPLVHTHSSQSAAIAIGNNTFKGEKFPMFEAKVTQYFKTHNIYHILETVQKGPSSRMSGGVEIHEDDQNTRRQTTMMTEKEYTFPPEDQVEGKDDRERREAYNIEVEKYNILVVKTNAQRTRKAAGLTRDVSVCFAGYTYIFTALTTETAELFLHIVPGNVYALWEAIKNKYKGVTLISQSHIRDMMSTVHLSSNEDVDAYVARINGYQLQLQALKSPMTQDDLIYRLYKGLPESYNNLIEIIRKSARMSGTDLAFDEIVTMLREHQIEQRNKTSHTQAHIAYEQAFSLSNTTQQAQINGNNNQQPKIQTTTYTQKYKGNKPAPTCFRCLEKHFIHKCTVQKDAVTCDTCKAKGHLTSQHDKYTLIAQRRAASAAAFVCSDVVLSIDNNSIVVVNDLGDIKGVNKGDNPALNLVNDALLIGDVTDHILDSGATNHFVATEDKLQDVISINPIRLRTAGDDILTGVKSGTICIPMNDGTSNTISFHNAICVPGLTTNLISVSQLTDNGCTITFNKNEATITNTAGQTLKIPKVGKLYVMKGSDVMESAHHESAHHVVDINRTSNYGVKNLSNFQLLHARLGHLSATSLQTLIKSGGCDNMDIDLTHTDVNELKNCDACLQGKSTRQSFNSTRKITVSGTLDCIHSDVCGRINGQYFITFTDEYSRKIGATIINYKSDSEDVIKVWIIQQETQLNKKVKSFHSDNGGEYISKALLEWFNSKGIIVTTSVAHTPERNPLAERLNRTLIEMVKTILIASNLLKHSKLFWTYALQHAVYVRNRCTTKGLTGINANKVPEEVWSGTKVDMKYIRVFGCDVYVHVEKKLREDKLAPTGDKGIHLGYDQSKHAYYIYVLKTQKIISQHSVNFFENSFTNAVLIDVASETDMDIGITDMDNVIGDTSGDDDDMSFDDIADRNEIEFVKRISLEDQKGKMGNQTSNVLKTNHVTTPHISSQTNDTTHYDREGKYSSHQTQRDNETSRSHINTTISDPPLAHIVPLTVSVPSDIDVGGSTVRRSGRSSVKVNRLGMVDERDIGDYYGGDNYGLSVQTDVLNYTFNNDLLYDDDALVIGYYIDSNEAFYIGDNIDLIQADHPRNYTEAMESVGAEKWLIAMNLEMDGLHQNNVLQLCDKPLHKRALGTQWVLATKLNSNGTIDKYKARLVVRGDQQCPGIDYDTNNIYAPVVGIISLRMVLTIVCILDYELYQMDVTQAFPNADVNEEIYIRQPQGYDDGTGRVYRLLKALYGIVQAPFLWNQLLDAFMVSCGWVACISDPCVYTFVSQTGNIMLFCAYVDDCLGACASVDIAEYNCFKVLFMNRFRTKDLGECQWILKMELKRNRKARTLFLSQELYIEKLVQVYKLGQTKSVSVPEVNHIKLGKYYCPDNGSIEQKNMKNYPYREMVGSLLYATHTRPDIAHVVNMLARYLINPGMVHYEAALTVIKYLKGTSTYGLLYTGYETDGITIKSIDINAYTDADWAGNVDSFKSTSGGIVCVGGNIIDAYTRSQHTVSYSSTESELIAAIDLLKVVKWCKNLLSELTFKQTSATTIYCDNESTINSTLNKGMVSKLKHMNIRYAALKDEVKYDTIKLVHVASKDNIADLLTKCLTPKPFKYLRDLIVQNY